MESLASGPCLPGLGPLADALANGFVQLDVGGDGRWRAGRDGVRHILAPRDRKVEFIVFADHTLAYVTSAMGYPAIYPLREALFTPPVQAILMDLDGTSVHSERFWVWIIQQVTARLLGQPHFELEAADEPFVSGHSVSEHLQHCLRKYCPDRTVEEARRLYFEITHRELSEILAGGGRADAFTPAPGLKEFLLAVKGHGIRIGLVTSGLYEKAWPEIVSAFRVLGMGDPLDFYDAIISAGSAIRRGQVGTLGELEPKPHPWLYAETARVGLGIPPEASAGVIGIEDSSAGVVAIRLAGFAAIGVAGGNIASGGARPLLHAHVNELLDALPLILGQ
ncbi:MAG: 2-deoxyglucose-6-phosphatase [Lentisphaerae bacterium ADurb.BinA184]|nr:MAG: 2-deoxyglucose-6-phosphatase [Lentisphaerae bacterium ADurb.BinA184]